METGGGGRWSDYSGDPVARRGQQAGVGPLLAQGGGGQEQHVSASVRRVEFTVAAPMADVSSLPGPMRAAASSTPYIGTRALERGSLYGARAVRGGTANGSLGAARCAYSDVRGSAGEVRRCGHWLGGGEVGLLDLRRWDAWRRGFGCERRCVALGPAVTAGYRRSCPVGGGAADAAKRARRRAWA
jgi:hypothetical protein